jgi:DNA-binding MarR family transcriptional regulator
MRAEDFDKVEFEDPYEEVLANIYFTHVWLNEKYQALLKRYGVTMQQYNVLGFLYQMMPHSTDLQSVKRMLMEPGADATRLITRLKAKGLVSSKVNSSNKRKIEISLTDSGKKLMQKIKKEGPVFHEEVTYKLSSKEAVQLVKLLHKIRS